MKILIDNTLIIQDATVDFREWLKKNCVLGNPDFERKLRMGFWMGDTPEYIYLYEKRDDKIILPVGAMDFIPLDFLLESEILDIRNVPETRFKIKNLSDFGLYNYQEKAVRSLIGLKQGILQAPAGSGKTQMGLALIGIYAYKTLWITHTLDLLRQSKERALRYFDKKELGEISAGKVNIGKITFATVQTLCKLDLSAYKNEWDMIVVDECHRAAGSPTTMTRYYKVLNNLAAMYKFGLSATLHRSDGLIRSTHYLLGKTAYVVPKEEVDDKIMTVTIKPVDTGLKPSYEIVNTDGTLNYQKMMTYICTDLDRNKLISRQLVIDREQSVLVLSDRVSHLEDLFFLLPKSVQDEAAVIHGKMTGAKGKAYREQVLDDMRNGRKHILFATYALAKEGLDIPCLTRLYLTTPHKDYAVITQAIGRVARVHEGKTEAICLDFVDNIPYCAKAYRQRCTVYRKNNCEWI